MPAGGRETCSPLSTPLLDTLAPMKLSYRICTLLILAVPASPVLAASGPQPITVQGVVEVINDVLRQPYIKRVVLNFPADTISAVMHFDIPAGKRLITEVISIEVLHLENTSPLTYANVMLGDVYVPFPVSFQSKTPFNGRIAAVGTHAIALRVDGKPDGVTGSTAELSFSVIRDAVGPSTSVTISVAGILVDIP